MERDPRYRDALRTIGARRNQQQEPERIDREQLVEDVLERVFETVQHREQSQSLNTLVAETQAKLDEAAELQRIRDRLNTEKDPVKLYALAKCARELRGHADLFPK